MVHDTGATGATGSRTAFPCNTCSVSFESSGSQRSHMRVAWHIHNLQRKISGQPALSESEFTDFTNDNNGTGKRKKTLHTNTTPESSHRDSRPKSPNSSSDTDIQANHQPTPPSNLTPAPSLSTCLFCPITSPTLSANLTHMSSTHTFFLSSSSSPTTSAIEPLLSYLSLLIYTYHECIYCAREKGSVKSVQSHMRDRGHCKVEVGLWEEFFFSSKEEGEEEEAPGKARAREEGRERLRPFPKARRREVRQSKTSLQQREEEEEEEEEEDGAKLGVAEQVSSLVVSSSPSELSSDPLLLPTPAPPITGRNTALSLSGLSTAQLVSLATLDKKMRRQQVVAQKKVSQQALGQPVKAIYYKTENPVYQAG